MAEPQAVSQVLQAIHDQGPLSRSAIARATGVSLSAVSLITKTLLAEGFIEETGTARKGMGRPSILLEVRSDSAYFVGGCINRDSLVAVLTDLTGNVLGQRAAGLASFAPDIVVGEFAALVTSLVEDAELPVDRLTGAGFAISGIVDSEAGLCRHSTVLGWRDIEIRSLLERAIGLPVELENDANAVTVGERLFGTNEATDDFAVLSVGHGIGAGFFLNGRLYHGEHGVSGEVGHFTVDPAGPPCPCGKHGCLEAIASVPAMLAAARDAGLMAASLDELEELAVHGGPARSILERSGTALGLALSYLVNMLAPALVIVTGSGVRLGYTLQGALRTSFSRHLLPLLPQPPRLSFQNEDEGVWARGAASLAAQSFIRTGGGNRRHGRT